jgi:hypothetical protein
MPALWDNFACLKPGADYFGRYPNAGRRQAMSPLAQTFSSDKGARRLIERRAAEAVNWGMSAVNYDR